MNFWTKLSVEFAQQCNYLDELYKVYPISPNLRREIDTDKWEEIQSAFEQRNNTELINKLLELDLFPIKDSFVPYLRRDHTAIERNPQTINRLSGYLYEMGLSSIFDKCTQPKETNRQIGPMFKNWINKKTIGVPVLEDSNSFLNAESNCIFNSSDEIMKNFANRYLGYKREKGIDFMAKFNNKYVIAETKFLTDFGGHQDAQFDDAISTMKSSFKNKDVANDVIPICVLDGVLYIKGKNKMYRYLEEHSEQIIISALLLREFLYSL